MKNNLTVSQQTPVVNSLVLFLWRARYTQCVFNTKRVFPNWTQCLRAVCKCGEKRKSVLTANTRFSFSQRLYGPSDPAAIRCCRNVFSVDICVRVKMNEETVCAVQLGENFCLYFADDDGLECDALCKEKTLHRVLRNVNSQLLVVRPDLNMAAFEDVTDQEMKSGKGMHFNIHYYKTTTPSAGMPVAFSIQVEDKSYYMCCEKECGKMTVRFREGEVPKEMPGESNIIFFKKTFTSCSSRAFKFEYSLEQGMFLAFEKEGYLRKLILKKLSREDEVDETMKISF